MQKYIALAFKFLKLSWMTNMEYRSDFITWGLIDIGWTIMDLIFFSALLTNIKSIGSWTFPEMLIMLGVSRIMVVPVWAWMYQSFSQISALISKGNLDLLLTKPINSQFMVSVRHFSFSIAPSLIGGLILITFGFRMLNYVPSILSIGLALILLIVSIIMIYGMYFSTISLILFVDRLNNIHHIFPHAFDSGRYPPEIFPGILQRILTTAIPIGLMIVVPAGALLLKTDLWQVVKLSILAIIFFNLSRWLWTKGLSRYSSASS
jgi:ABC-2 type transport system permease protein